MYGPLIKWGLIVLAFLSAVGSLIGFGEWHGRKAIQTRWDTAVAQQALAAASTVIESAQNTAKVEVKYIKVQAASKVITKTIEKEVIKYVESPPEKCVLGPDFVRVFDRLSGVLNSGGGDGVSTDADSAGDAVAPSASVVTDASVLLAYETIVSQYLELWDTYRALVEWVRTSHAVMQEE